MPLRQRGLDRLLTRQQPVERLVRLRACDRTQTQDRAETARGRSRIKPLHCREFRGRGDDPPDDHRERQITRPIALGPQDPVETDLADRSEHRRHVPVRQRADHLEGLLSRRHDDAAPEKRPETLDPLGRPVGQVRERPFPDLAVLAIGLAQEDRRR